MYIIEQLEKNKAVFRDLLTGVQDDLIRWKQLPDKWCLLEIACHLYDEERDDFRFRTQWTLDRPGEVPPPFDQLSWVSEHRYIEQDYNTVVHNFIEERDRSVQWLKGLRNPNWENAFEHPKLGKMTAKYFLFNWLAHDYLHIRQILKLKFDFLREQSGDNLDYAGTW
jgi:hypothetical protein